MGVDLHVLGPSEGTWDGAPVVGKVSPSTVTVQPYKSEEKILSLKILCSHYNAVS